MHWDAPAGEARRDAPAERAPRAEVAVASEGHRRQGRALEEMPVLGGCEVSLKAPPATAQGAEAAQAPAWWGWGKDRLGRAGSGVTSPRKALQGPGRGRELSWTMAEGSSGAQSRAGYGEGGAGPAELPHRCARGQASERWCRRLPQPGHAQASASTPLPSQPSPLWGQSWDAAATAGCDSASPSPACPLPTRQGLRHRGSTRADALHARSIACDTAQ